MVSKQIDSNYALKSVGLSPVFLTPLMILSLCPDVLKRGGNAADAAVAIAAALAVTEPCSTGPGGDAFCLFYNGNTGEIKGINGRSGLHSSICYLVFGNYLSLSFCPQWSFTSGSDLRPL